MNYINILTTLSTLLLLTHAELSSEKARVAQLLIDKKFPEFESSLREFLAMPTGLRFWLSTLSPTESCQYEMLEILKTKAQNYVVLSSNYFPSSAAHNMLIPQCTCQQTTAFILEYKVRTLKPMFTEDNRLKNYAQKALDSISVKSYDSIVATFHHVKEIVKVGMAFSKWNQTALVHEIVQLNRSALV